MTNEKSLEAVLVAMDAVQDQTIKRQLRDLSIELTNAINAERMQRTLDAVSKVQDEAVTMEDAELIDKLVGKAVLANGFNPELTTAQIGRTIAVIGTALARILLGTLTPEDQNALDEVFDLSCDEVPPESRLALRTLEAKVRVGLGLPPRGLGLNIPKEVS